MVVRSIDMDNGVVDRDGEQGMESCCLRAFSFARWVSSDMGAVAAQWCECSQCHRTVTLKNDKKL